MCTAIAKVTFRLQLHCSRYASMGRFLPVKNLEELGELPTQSSAFSFSICWYHSTDIMWQQGCVGRNTLFNVHGAMPPSAKFFRSIPAVKLEMLLQHRMMNRYRTYCHREGSHPPCHLAGYFTPSLSLVCIPGNLGESSYYDYAISSSFGEGGFVLGIPR
jgi:hypothetical protein